MTIEMGGRYVERRVAERLAREGGEPNPEEVVEILRTEVDLTNGQNVPSSSTLSMRCASGLTGEKRNEPFIFVTPTSD